jgi:hypothetical protein
MKYPFSSSNSLYPDLAPDSPSVMCLPWERVFMVIRSDDERVPAAAGVKAKLPISSCIQLMMPSELIYRIGTTIGGFVIDRGPH